MANLEGLPSNLRRARERAGLTQAEAAKLAELHPQQLSDYERGVKRPTDDSLGRLASVYGETIPALRYGKDAPSAPATSDGHLPPGQWPYDARVFLHDFIAEAVRNGATEDDVLFVRNTLVSPHAYVMYAGGGERAMDDEELLIQMQGLAEGLRVWLSERKRRRSERA